MQDRFCSGGVIHNSDLVVSASSRAVRAARELGVPTVVTEQYPKAFGPTVPAIAQHLPGGGEEAVPKKHFSMVVPEVEEKLGAMPARQQVLLCGLEAHVCVFQTTCDLLERGYQVHLLVDAISSSRPEERAAALRRLEAAGAHLSTVETALFDLMRGSTHERFKAVSAIIRDRPEGATQMGA